MRAPAGLLAIALAAFAALPLAGASLGQATPVAAACALVDTDGCTQAWASTDGMYGLLLAGRFTGTATIHAASATNPWSYQSISCTGELVGIVMASGYCTIEGYPPTGPLVVTCTSAGSGGLACLIAGR